MVFFISNFLMKKHWRFKTLKSFRVFTSHKYAAHWVISCTRIGFELCMKVEKVKPVESGHGYGNGYPLEVLGRWMEKIWYVQVRLGGWMWSVILKINPISPKLLLKYRQGSMTFNCCKYAVYYCRPFAGVGNFVWGIWSLYVAVPGVVGNWLTIWSCGC